MTHLLAVLGLMLAASSPASAVVFRSDNFFDPAVYLQRAQGDRELLARAFSAVVLIGGHATGVIVSPDGLMMTARHTIADDFPSGTGDDCRRIPLFLNHERDLDGTRDARLVRIYCERILVSEYSDDYVLLKLATPAGFLAGFQWPFAPPELDPGAIHEGMRAIVAGHPHALDFEKGIKKVSDGPIVLYRPLDPDLPHFLHLIDTEPGDSGAPVLTPEGKLIGIHFRGVPRFGDGVDVLRDGQTVKLHTFNVSLVVPYLVRKYGTGPRPGPGL